MGGEPEAISVGTFRGSQNGGLLWTVGEASGELSRYDAIALIDKCLVHGNIALAEKLSSALPTFEDREETDA